MMFKLETLMTAEQIEKLHKAVNLAKNPGSCRYVDPHFLTPDCVIAQLAYLEGCPVPDMQRWSGVVGALRMDGEQIDPLPNYPPGFLRRLQTEWDIIDDTSLRIVADTKKRMHELIDTYQGELNGQMGETSGAF